MYKVLIVDDDVEIREGLKLIFPWVELGIDEVLTAEDGDSALALSLRSNPDLIITDIKMNRMTGLDFISKLYRNNSFTGKAVIISGYDDFELVKQALQLGAVDYILKPINIDELKLVLFKAIDLIRGERMQRQNQLFLENQVQEALPRMREEVLRVLTEHAYNPYWETTIMDRLEHLKAVWLANDCLVLLMVEVDDLRAIEQRKKNQNEKELVLFAIGNVIMHTIGEEYRDPSMQHQDKQGRWIVQFSYKTAEQLELCKAIGQLLIMRINTFVNVNVSIGLALSAGGLKELSKAYREASSNLEQKVVYGGKKLFVADIASNDDSENGVIALNDMDVVLDLIKFGSEQDIRKAMDAYQELIRTWSLKNIRDIQERTFEWLLELSQKATSTGLKVRWQENSLISMWDQLEQFDTLESLQKQTEFYLLDMAMSFKNQPAMQSQTVTEAKKYIKTFYKNALTLQLVAEQVHITSEWLSKLFKKETGVTFLEYLTEIRIEKAKEMLLDVKYKIYHVSQEVGYRDPVHFTKLFKKIVGCSPREFRSLQGINDD